MTVGLTVTAARSVDGKARVKVPIVDVELGGGASLSTRSAKADGGLS
jgi:hypothetical protein